MTGRPSRILQVFRSATMSVVLAAGFFAAAELLLLATGLPDPGIYAGDIRSFWTLRPDLPPQDLPFRERGTTFRVRTNQSGFRGAAPVEGATLCLGDSTTFGWGVEEDEAWPAVLGELLGAPTINGGVPGYSTHQGRIALAAALRLRPRTVVLAYLVRDAERAPVADADRPEPPWDPRILQLLRKLRPAPSAAHRAGVPRVSAAAYIENLRQMIAEISAAGASPVLLQFPTLPADEVKAGVSGAAPVAEHQAALAQVAAAHPGLPLLVPAFELSHFFPEDPIHRTVEGTRALALAVAAGLSGP